MTVPILVSACLVGFQCRYDGTSRLHAGVLKALEGHTWMAVCPEQRAGFPTPRDPIMFEGGTGEAAIEGFASVVSVTGLDVTRELVAAADSLARLASAYGVERGILKERSPSCGVREVYVGDERVAGEGVFTAMLRQRGVTIISEEDLDAVKRNNPDDF
ncbi:MAG: DUF523 domain-containing protein [Deltaproteobacteria bacterium]|nr:MAG: DUF523 domain-containing protein [Deltaproteobacteria bacterium]